MTMVSAFQEVHDRLAIGESNVTYSAPTNSLPPGFGVGPPGSMKIEILPDLECPGHEGGTIQLTYDIPTAPQRPYHPNPGVPYDGVRRRSYIPNTPEGRCLLTRYKYAFNHGHMFLVGRSVAKNKDNQVTWSTLPNHTTLKGTAFGFPDPEYMNKAAAALAKLRVPSADDIVHPKAPDIISIRSLGAITPMAPPSGGATAPCAVDDTVVPLPPPYLFPDNTPNLAAVTFPESWNLSSKETKRCTVISTVNDGAALKRFVVLRIPVEASEIVVSINVKDLATTADKNKNLQDIIKDASSGAVTRACRAALLTRGSLQLKKLPMMKTGAFAAVADRGNPNIKFGLFDLRAVHLHRDVVLLAYYDDCEDNSGNMSRLGSRVGKIIYALYQTPEPSRFLTKLVSAAIAAYVGMPNWAIPITWSGSLPALQAITNRDYTKWMGVDGGFSSCLYAAALSYHVKHKLEIGKLDAGNSAVTNLIMDGQTSRVVPTKWPELLNLLSIATGIAMDDNMVHPMVAHGLNALAFNLVFRKLKLSKYRLPADISGFRNALFKALLYNVTLREVDFSGTNLSGLGEGIGKSWAMNAQPLISRINFSNCHLTGRDLRGILPGLGRIWCGQSALVESIKMAGNNTIPTATWDFFFQTFDDPAVLPFWPQTPPPPPSLAFLQELDLMNTKALGPGLAKLSGKLSGLRVLKISCCENSDASEICQALVAANAPLETLVGSNLTFSSVAALFGLRKTLRNMTFDGFRGNVTPLFCDWPADVKNLTIAFSGKLTGATFYDPVISGFTPGSLKIENDHNFGFEALNRALAIQATGLKRLNLSNIHYSQLSKAVPVLTFCGLESLVLGAVAQNGPKLRGEHVSDMSRNFWSVLASSKTLRELSVPIQSASEVALLGKFLKTNRSVQRINFDGSFLLTVESVKELRSAFYGNKKVVDLQYPEKAKYYTMAHGRKDTQKHLQQVATAKAQIKRLFKSHYSKYNRNWRDAPNRLKLPLVENIRQAKRAIGKNQRDAAKIGALLEEINNCVVRNRREGAEIAEGKRNVKLVRKEGQIKQMATKKTKFFSTLVTKLHNAKLKSRQNKLSKTCLPRSAYYTNRHMWPSASGGYRRHRAHSSYRYYNDPYNARYHNHYGFYDHSCDAERQTYLDEDDHSALAAVASLNHATHLFHETESSSEDDRDGQTAILMETTGVWNGQLCDVENLFPISVDPWETIDTLIHFGENCFSAILSSEFLCDMHNEIADLGLDVVSDICGTLDYGAAVNEQINEISESLDVASERLETIVDSTLENSFDLAALESSLGEIPDYDGDVDADAAMETTTDDADDAVSMYAGAGPRDLDDGGPSFGGFGNAVLAGAQRRARMRKENRKLRRVREKRSNRLRVGYKNLTLQEKPSEMKSTPTPMWPAYPKESWIESFRTLQVEVMSESNLFQLPDVSEDDACCLLLEWKVLENNELNMISDIECALVTQCSLDRLPNLEEQLAAWGGKASVAIYLKPKECLEGDVTKVILSRIRNARERADKAHLGRGGFDVAVTIVEGHLDDEPYPINYLRNVALLEARSQHLRFHSSLKKSAVLLVDVDFRPSENLHETLHTVSAADIILKSKNVIVCPAFEAAAGFTTPKSMGDLREYVDNGKAEGFHLSHFPEGHGPTSFEHFWKQSSACEDGNMEDNWQKAYDVTYETLFEPYVCLATQEVPLYDERFQGYGLNKVSHLASIAKQKTSRFLVLPGVFLVAPAHERSHSWFDRYGSRSDETKFDQLWLKGLYHNFMRGLAEGRETIVSNQTRAKYCLQRMQANESNSKETTSLLAEFPIQRHLVVSSLPLVKHSRA